MPNAPTVYRKITYKNNLLDFLSVVIPHLLNKAFRRVNFIDSKEFARKEFSVQHDNM